MPASSLAWKDTQMNVHDHVNKARVELVKAKDAYRSSQLEAWGLLEQVSEALNPGNEDMIGESLAREFTILLDAAAQRARSVKHCEKWLRAAEDYRFKQGQPETVQVTDC